MKFDRIILEIKREIGRSAPRNGKVELDLKTQEIGYVDPLYKKLSYSHDGSNDIYSNTDKAWKNIEDYSDYARDEYDQTPIGTIKRAYITRNIQPINYSLTKDDMDNIDDIVKIATREIKKILSSESTFDPISDDMLNFVVVGATEAIYNAVYKDGCSERNLLKYAGHDGAARAFEFSKFDSEEIDTIGIEYLSNCLNKKYNTTIEDAGLGRIYDIIIQRCLMLDE